MNRVAEHHLDRRNPAMVGLVLLILVYIGRVQELIPGADDLNIGKIVVALSLVLFFRATRTIAVPLASTPQVRYFFWLTLLALLGTPFSVWPTASWQFLTGSHFKALLFLFLLILIVETVRELEIVVWSVALADLSLCLSLFLNRSAGRMSAGTSYDPNDLAFVLITTLPLVYYLMKESEGKKKWFLAVVIALILIANISTASRGGFLGLLAVGVAILLKQGKKIHQAVVPLLAVFILLQVFAPDTYWDRMSSMTDYKEDYNVKASSGRVEVWKRGVKIMLQNPVLGVGINCFGIAEGHAHGGDGKWSTAHNSFIQIGAELGLLGVFLFVGMITSSIKTVRDYQGASASGLPAWLLNGVEVSFYGYVVTGFFLSQGYSSVLYLLIGLAVVCKRIALSQSGVDDMNAVGQVAGRAWVKH